VYVCVCVRTRARVCIYCSFVIFIHSRILIDKLLFNATQFLGPCLVCCSTVHVLSHPDRTFEMKTTVYFKICGAPKVCLNMVRLYISSVVAAVG
jgi:hypothetical protein